MQVISHDVVLHVRPVEEEGAAMSTVRQGEREVIAAAWPALEPIFLVRNVQASTAFYREKLGFSVEDHWEASADGVDVVPGAIVSSRGVRHVGGFTAFRIRLQQVEPDQPLPAPGAIVLIHVTDHIEQLADSYREQGVQLVAELTRLPDGTRTFSVCDPNGHILHFAESGSPARRGVDSSRSLIVKRKKQLRGRE